MLNLSILNYIIRNYTNIIALFSTVLIIFQYLITYFMSYKYNYFFNIPVNYFKKINKRSFYESFFILIGFIVIFYLYVFLSFKILNQSKRIDMYDLVIIYFCILLFILFPCIVFLQKLFKKYTFTCFILCFLFPLLSEGIILYINNKLQIEQDKLIIPFALCVIIYIISLLIYVGKNLKLNPAKIRDYSIIEQNNETYAVIFNNEKEFICVKCKFEDSCFEEKSSIKILKRYKNFFYKEANHNLILYIDYFYIFNKDEYKIHSEIFNEIERYKDGKLVETSIRRIKKVNPNKTKKLKNGYRRITFELTNEGRIEGYDKIIVDVGNSIDWSDKKLRKHIPDEALYLDKIQKIKGWNPPIPFKGEVETTEYRAIF